MQWLPWNRRVEAEDKAPVHLYNDEECRYAVKPSELVRINAVSTVR